MSKPADPRSDSQARVNQVIAAWLEALDAGRAPSREELIARHPDLADELRAFFADHDEVGLLAAPLRGAADSAGLSTPTLAEETGPAPPPAKRGKPSRTALPRETRFDDYELKGEIARGGMGAVLRGRDTVLGREVAVKVLLEAHAGRTELVQRFVEEAQVAGQLQHPGVVPVYELGRLADRRPYFTMKLVKGRTLAALLRGRKDPAEDRPRLLAIFQAVCQAVAYAHSRGVIHRDLKPANVMVGSFGEVQVMDWGLAKVLKEDGASSGEDRRAEEATVIRTADGGSETQAGSVLGTPAYMAPEQARGEVERLGRSCDVFGLGAILCEILTGRPPFAGPKEQVFRQAQRGDLADAFARLDGSGADGELIGLAKQCLAAEPDGRPRDAGEVASAVTAYLDGVAERLRRAEVEKAQAQVKAAEERKRRRLAVVLAAAVLLLVAVGAGGGLWAEREKRARLEDAARVNEERIARKAETDRQVHEALAEAARLRGQALAGGNDPATWRAVEAAVKQARAALEAGEADDDTRQRVEEQLARAVKERQDAEARAAERDKDRRMVGRLGDLRLRTTEVKDGLSSPAEIDTAYRNAFRDFGADVEGDPEKAAALLAGRAIRVELAAALDDWALARRTRTHGLRPTDDGRWRPLVEMARRVDPDPRRNEVREAVARRDPKALRTLAADPEAVKLPAPTVMLLGRTLGFVGDPKAAAEFFLRAQRHRPEDFWINEELAFFLMDQEQARPDEAIRYYTAAVALRPDSIGAQLNLAHALRHKDAVALEQRYGTDYRPHNPRSEGADKLPPEATADLEEPIAIYRRLLARSLPWEARASTLFELGVTLGMKNDVAGAVEALEECVKLAPNSSRVHHWLGLCYKDLGRDRLPDAIKEFERALQIDPEDHSGARVGLGTAWMLLGERAKAIAAWKEATGAPWNAASAWKRLGVALRQDGQTDEGIAALRKAVAADPNSLSCIVALAIAVEDAGRIDETVALLRRAYQKWPDSPVLPELLGIALLERDSPQQAVPYLRRGAELAPNLCDAQLSLGVALGKCGEMAASLEHLRKGLRLAGADPRKKGQAEKLIRHAEEFQRLQPRLNKVLLDPDADPADAAEAVALAKACQEFNRRYFAAAGLFACAFKKKPALADDLAAAHRYNAACVAAMAGCGRGIDAGTLNGEDRAGLRRRALAWLRDDLAAWMKRLEGGGPADRKEVREKMKHWQKDYDLIGVRDAEALKRLPAGEREDWKKLWADVRALQKRAEGKE